MAAAGVERGMNTNTTDPWRGTAEMSAADVAAATRKVCRFRCYGICTAPELCAKTDAELTDDDRAEIDATHKAFKAYEEECWEQMTAEEREEWERSRPVPKEQLAFTFPVIEYTLCPQCSRRHAHMRGPETPHGVIIGCWIAEPAPGHERPTPDAEPRRRSSGPAPSK